MGSPPKPSWAGPGIVSSTLVSFSVMWSRKWYICINSLLLIIPLSLATVNVLLSKNWAEFWLLSFHEAGNWNFQRYKTYGYRLFDDIKVLLKVFFLDTIMVLWWFCRTQGDRPQMESDLVESDYQRAPLALRRGSELDSISSKLQTNESDIAVVFSRFSPKATLSMEIPWLLHKSRLLPLRDLLSICIRLCSSPYHTVCFI